MEQHSTRESWLMHATDQLAPTFAELGFPLGTVRVGCGFPSHGALSRSRKVIGQCWATEASADGASELFISPVLIEPMAVLATLGHELIHAAVGVVHGHKGPFVQVMGQLGLTGKPTATEPGEAFLAMAAPILAELGDYPHAAFDPQARRKQSTRLILIECDDCEAEGNPYKLRVSAKALAEHGAPICPVHELPFAVKG